MQELLLEKENVSLLERCPHFRSFLRERSSTAILYIPKKNATHETETLQTYKVVGIHGNDSLDSVDVFEERDTSPHLRTLPLLLPNGCHADFTIESIRPVQLIISANNNKQIPMVYKGLSLKTR